MTSIRKPGCAVGPKASIATAPRHGREGLVDGLRVNVDAEHWDRNVLSAIYSGIFELPERRACQRLLAPGDRVVELGTGMGLVAMTAARRVEGGAVTSYEADPHLLPFARASMEANGLSIDLHQAAVLSALPPHRHTVDFYRHGNFAVSSIRQPADAAERLEVAAVSLSAVLADAKPDVLIADIEGGEAGIGEVITASDLRKVIVEVHPHVLGIEVCDAIGEQLTTAGFAVAETLSDGQVLCFERDAGSARSFRQTSASAVLHAILRQAHSRTEAVEGLRQALGRCPENAAIHLRLSTLLRQDGAFEDAAQHAAEAGRLEPERFDGHVALAQAYRRLNRFDDALEALAPAMAFAGDIVAVWGAALDVHSARRDQESALSAASRIVDLNPLHAHAWFRRARLAAALGRAEAARESIVEAAGLNPNDARVGELQQVIKQRFGNGEQA